MVDMNGKIPYDRAANRVVVLAPALPACQATLQQLQDRLEATARGENQLAAIRAETLNEINRRQGPKKTEEILRDKALLPPRRARQEIETAQELKKLPKTREGLRKGDISHDNARILAGANQRGNIDEDELVDLAKTQPPNKFAGTVRKHEQQRSQDDGLSRLEHQRSRRYARIRTDRDDGMTVLYGRFDPITGAAIENILSAKTNEMWREEEPGNRPTPGQRMADALQILLTGQPGSQNGRRPATKLLVIADYDAVGGQLNNARLPDGTPVPAGKLRQLACDAGVLPAIFRGPSQPLDLGRGRRRASITQRNALLARDGKCIGCGAKAAWCQAHHITHWMDGGPTNLANLVLLCSRCHHKVHDDQWRVAKDPTGTFTLRPPRNHRRRSNKSRTHRRRPTIKQRK